MQRIDEQFGHNDGVQATHVGLMQIDIDLSVLCGLEDNTPPHRRD